MKRSLRLLVAPLALVLGAGSAAVIGTGQSTSARVYTVAEVQAGLARSPEVWVGRTVLVRGIAVAGEPVDYLSPSLVDADASAAVDPLPLAWAGLDPLRAFLRRLPWLASLAPRAQALRWDEVAVYRVQLRVQARAYGGAGVCYEALLLDAALDAPGEG
jgi:hypothetical protein